MNPVSICMGFGGPGSAFPPTAVFNCSSFPLSEGCSPAPCHPMSCIETLSFPTISLTEHLPIPELAAFHPHHNPQVPCVIFIFPMGDQESAYLVTEPCLNVDLPDSHTAAFPTRPPSRLRGKESEGLPQPHTGPPEPCLQGQKGKVRHSSPAWAHSFTLSSLSEYAQNVYSLAPVGT